jgi:hypothetical protein
MVHPRQPPAYRSSYWTTVGFCLIELETGHRQIVVIKDAHTAKLIELGVQSAILPSKDNVKITVEESSWKRPQNSCGVRYWSVYSYN